MGFILKNVLNARRTRTAEINIIKNEMGVGNLYNSWVIWKAGKDASNFASTFTVSRFAPHRIKKANQIIANNISRSDRSVFKLKPIPTIEDLNKWENVPNSMPTIDHKLKTFNGNYLDSVSPIENMLKEVVNCSINPAQYRKILKKNRRKKIFILMERKSLI